MVLDNLPRVCNLSVHVVYCRSLHITREVWRLLPAALNCRSAVASAARPLAGGTVPMPILSSLARSVGFEAMPPPPHGPHCMLCVAMPYKPDSNLLI